MGYVSFISKFAIDPRTGNIWHPHSGEDRNDGERP